MFYTAWFCVNCHSELSYNNRMYSHGRCSACGYKGKNAGTIVDTYEKAYTIEKIPSGKWWIPDKKVKKYKDINYSLQFCKFIKDIT